MKRYIVNKTALDILSIEALDAQTELASSKVITNETLVFRHLPYVSMMLDDTQVALLNERSIFPEEEVNRVDVSLGAENSGYEKLRSSWYKTQKRGFTGKGCKVAVLDSGCNQSVVPWDFGYNFVDSNTNVTDVYGHGTQVCSIIKHPIIALAANCELHMLKVIDDGGAAWESAVLTALDYVISNQIDIINLSWQFDTINIRNSIAAVIANGTVVSAASGNSNVETYTVSPACLPGVVAVNAISYDFFPGFKSIMAPPGIPNSHGITIACDGVSCQCYTKTGVRSASWGTSFSAPFFAGTFALYKEMLGLEDNYKVLDYVLRRAQRRQETKYYGVGLVNF